MTASSPGAGWKIATFVSTCALLAVLGFLFFNTDFQNAASGRRIGSAAIVTQVKRLNQLATVRYSIQRVVGLTEARQPVGQESILLMVQGEAIAGVDLVNLKSEDIRYMAERSAVVSLPPAKLLNTYLDENQTKVWDRHITWWTPWVPYDPDLERRARLQALNDVRDAALRMGILDQAQHNAEQAIRGLLATFGIDVTFKNPSL